VSLRKNFWTVATDCCHSFSSVDPSVTSILIETSDMSKFHIFVRSPFTNTYILITLLIVTDISKYKFKIHECDNFHKYDVILLVFLQFSIL